MPLEQPLLKVYIYQLDALATGGLDKVQGFAEGGWIDDMVKR